MDGYVAVVSPHLPSSIVSQQALARIRTVAAKLPPCSLAGLEFRLRDDRPEVDFFVRLPYATPRFDPSLVTDRVWQAAQRVCDEMSRPSGALHEQVRFLFLEFDLDAPPREIPIPALFFELHTDRSFSAGDLVAIASAVGPDCSRQDVSLEALGRCVSALPPGANVAHMAVMPSRPGGAMRIVIDGVVPTAVGSYLQAIGWRDSAGALASLVDEIAAIADPVVMVDIDIAETVRPKVGVEFYSRREPDPVLRWHALFDHLVNRGLASRTKTSALLDWPGFTQETATNPAWAENLSLGDLLFRGMAKSMFWRSLNHVKLTYQPGHEPEVKAYLGFGHSWFPTTAAAAPR